MDYSFMKTGNNLLDPPKMFNEKDLKNVQVMLSLFISNAMLNGSRYSLLCNRDGVTEDDVKYGIKYEVFEFMKRGDLMESLEEIKKEIEADDRNENLSDNEDENLDYNCESENDSFDGMIVGDDEIEDFKRFDINNINDIENEDDREFIEKFHKYTDEWESWVPETPLEKILKNAIDTKL